VTGVARRHLLTGGGAAAVLGLSGCATRGVGAAAGRVLIVGGGFGGATAARYLKLWGGTLVEVTLVERNVDFVSCPLSNLVIAGQRDLASITHPYAGLRAAGVRVVQDEATAIDAVARQVRLASAAALPYDRLILSPGIDFMTDAMPGLQAALASGLIAHAWKAGPQTALLRRQLQAMPDGGVFAIAIPNAPFRCPPGPYERACLVAAWMKQARPRSKLLVLDANPEIQSKKALFERAFAEHHAGILEYRPNNELQDVAGLTARLDFDDVRADVLNVIPPQRGGDLARRAGLLNVNQRWAGVDWRTLESTAVPGIHVLGDSTFSAPAMPKSAHMANQHGKVAAAAILEQLQGRPVNPLPMVMNTCYSFVTATEAVHVASVHRYEEAERTFKTVPGSGGLSAAASAQEGRLALSWAENIWADTLAL
jgi:sulfite dehydrogenase